jgi:hypothetical protein
MANGLSDATISEVLDHLLGNGSYTAPATFQLQLYTGDPHGAGSEVNVTTEDTAYLEQSITFEAEGTTTNNRAYNDLACTFAAVVYGTDAAPYDVTHWCVVDSLDAIIAAGAMPTTVNRLVGEPLVFAIGAIYVALERTA